MTNFQNSQSIKELKIDTENRLLDTLDLREMTPGPFSTTANSTLLSPINTSPNKEEVESGIISVYDDTFTHVFGIVMLSRTVLLVLGHRSFYSTNLLEHFAVIYLPFSISITHLLQLNKNANLNGLIKTVRFLFKVVLLFGLGTCSPATFNTQRDTLRNFAFFMFICRVYWTLVNLIIASTGKRMFSFGFLKSCLTFLTLIPLSISFFQTNSSMFYTWYSIGVILDVVTEIISDVIHIFFINRESIRVLDKVKHFIIPLETIQIQTRILLSISTYYLFERRVLSHYPDSEVSVQFQVENFVYGCFGVAIFISIFVMYDCLGNTVKSFKHILSLYPLVKLIKWVHLLLNGSLILLIGTVQLLINDINEAALIAPKFPVNMTLTLDLSSFSLSNPSETVGMNYLTSLVNESGILESETDNQYIAPMIGIVGFILICLSVLHLVIANTNNHRSSVGLFTLLVGSIVITVPAFRIKWNDMPFTGVLVGISLSLLVVSSIHRLVLHSSIQ
ncbi:hypothetical protein BC833DRAFT_571146 [Globomyces pollinis-pini]|nr:hypothetical protein BC833DRAFT_571146 [Globomyces pollinis-pini]